VPDELVEYLLVTVYVNRDDLDDVSWDSDLPDWATIGVLENKVLADLKTQLEIEAEDE
jgi:hypothetical protein